MVKIEPNHFLAFEPPHLQQEAVSPEHFQDFILADLSHVNPYTQLRKMRLSCLLYTLLNVGLMVRAKRPDPGGKVSGRWVVLVNVSQKETPTDW